MNTLTAIANSELRPLVLTLATTMNVLRFIPQTEADSDMKRQAYYSAKMAISAVNMALAEVISKMELIEVNNQRND